MSNPVCSLASLNLPCYRGQVLSPQQLKAIQIFLMASELKGIGGTDYTNNLIGSAAGGLVGDTVNLFDENVSLDALATFDVVIDHNNAVASGGATVVPISTRMQQIKCLLNVNPDLLERMRIFLKCQLGVHKSYPQ